MKPIAKTKLLDDIRQIDGWLSDREAWWLYQCSKTLNIKGEIVEIGSWKGKSTAALAAGLAASGSIRQVAAVDPHQGRIYPGQTKAKSTYRKFLGNLAKLKLTAQVKPIVRTSLVAARSWTRPVGFLFIDSLHDYAHAKVDFLAWRRYLRPGTIVAFHDGFCGIPGVWQAIAKHFFRANLIEVGVVGSIIYGIVGRANFAQQIRLQFDKFLITCAQSLNQKPLPAIFKKLLIHRVIRLLLLNLITLKAYRLK